MPSHLTFGDALTLIAIMLFCAYPTMAENCDDCTPEGLTPLEYTVDDHPGVVIHRRKDIHGEYEWTLTKWGQAMNQDGEWESRIVMDVDGFLDRTGFESPEAALECFLYSEDPNEST